jgi:hypothetical protein
LRRAGMKDGLSARFPSIHKILAFMDADPILFWVAFAP